MSYSSVSSEANPIVVCALYKFIALPHFKELREPLLDLLFAQDVHGTLLLASEGINGTIAGSRTGVDTVLAWLNSQEALAPIDTKESYTDSQPFKRTKVKLKKEIVTMGIVGIDPTQVVGTYVKPQEWNDLIRDPEVLLIDCRNDYEYQVGTFEGAVNPFTDTFREFPKYVEENLDPEKHKKVAMFCTGGIRCEKSTAYLKEQGFDDVYHLQGGILKYLEDVPKDDTAWQGECFVFDDRVTVNHDLEKGEYDQCNACRLPITEEDKQHPHYKKGVSCPHCFNKTTLEQRKRYAQRELQMQLAKQRGEEHIGGEAHKLLSEKRKAKKEALKRQQQAAKAKQQTQA